MPQSRGSLLKRKFTTFLKIFGNTARPQLLCVTNFAAITRYIIVLAVTTRVWILDVFLDFCCCNSVSGPGRRILGNVAGFFCYVFM